MHMGTKSLCNLSTIALLLASIQNVIQFKVDDRTSGTLFLTAPLISGVEND